FDYSGAIISPFKEMDGMEQPLFHWTPSIAPSTLVYYNASTLPALQGKMLSGSLSFKHVRISDPSEPAAPHQEMLRERNSRVRDIALSPDGTLYVATEVKNKAGGGEILRILPEQ
ncbi:MAG: PQQ-dependent sugar dehydrogenase, partial [Pseudomonadota bacterium]